MLHKCKAHGKGWCKTCVFATIGFLPEHLIWDKVPVFSYITHALGL